MNFANLVGQEIIVLIPRIHESRYQRVQLRGVEAGGLWLESQEVTTALLRAFGLAAAPTTPVLFFPYHEIGFAISLLDAPALDEKAFGV